MKSAKEIKNLRKQDKKHFKSYETNQDYQLLLPWNNVASKENVKFSIELMNVLIKDIFDHVKKLFSDTLKVTYSTYDSSFDIYKEYSHFKIFKSVFMPIYTMWLDFGIWHQEWISILEKLNNNDNKKNTLGDKDERYQIRQNIQFKIGEFYTKLLELIREINEKQFPEFVELIKKDTPTLKSDFSSLPTLLNAIPGYDPKNKANSFQKLFPVYKDKNIFKLLLKESFAEVYNLLFGKKNGKAWNEYYCNFISFSMCKEANERKNNAKGKKTENTSSYELPKDSPLNSAKTGKSGLLFKLLGIDNQTTFEKVRQAWKDAAKICHPDKNPLLAEEATKAMSMLNSFKDLCNDQNLFYEYCHSSFSRESTDAKIKHNKDLDHQFYQAKAFIQKRIKSSQQEITKTVDAENKTDKSEPQVSQKSELLRLTMV